MLGWGTIYQKATFWGHFDDPGPDIHLTSISMIHTTLWWCVFLNGSILEILSDDLFVVGRLFIVV